MRSLRTPPLVPVLFAALSCLLLAAAAAAKVAPVSPAPHPGLNIIPAQPVKPALVKPVKGHLTVLYGDDHIFAIVPPPGWVVDDTSGIGEKIRVVLYPLGQKWATAPTVMYSNPFHQDPHAPKTLAQMIDRDVADFHKNSPHGKVEIGAPIQNVKGHQAELRYFAPNGKDPLSAVAYYPEQDLVMLLVLDSKTTSGFRAALPGFNGMVSSYQFVGSNMPTPTTPRPAAAR